MKKNKLLIEYDFDFELLGLTSSAKGYRLAWEINTRLGVHLVKQADLVVGFKNEVERAFMYYAYETQLNRLKLFKNKPSEASGGKYYLVPEFPHFDFIILACLKEHAMTDELIDMIKQIPSVELVTSMELNTLKSKLNFVF